MKDNWIDDIDELQEEALFTKIGQVYDSIEYIVKTFRLHKWREPYSDEELENYVLTGEYKIDKSNNREVEFMNYKQGIEGVSINTLLRSEFDTRILENYGTDIVRIGEFKGGNSIVVCKCNRCDNIFIENASNLLRGKRVCCLGTISKGEMLIEKLLLNLKLKFKREYDDGCRNPKTGRKLPFDFVVEYCNKSYYIEVQGKQHYEAIKYFGGEESFQNLKYRDNIKKEYANNNGVYVSLSYREGDLKKLEDRFNEEFINKYKIV